MNVEEKMEEKKEIKEKKTKTKKKEKGKKVTEETRDIKNENDSNTEIEEKEETENTKKIEENIVNKEEKEEKEEKVESEEKIEDTKTDSKEETIEKEKKISKEQKQEPKKKKNPASKIIIAIVITAILAIAVYCGGAYFINVKKNAIDFRIIGEENITLEVGSEYTDEGFAATDNTKDISNKVKVDSNLDTSKIGNYQNSYNLKLVYLNINQTLYRNINVVDTTSPELKVDGKNTITAYLGDKFNYPKYSAIDNYDGDITKNVKVESDLDLNKIGRYEINYKVTDSSGNESTEKITVSVEKKKNPYVVVSIANQKLEYYEYDKLVLSSSVVTGINGKTPRGNFKVLNKARDIILKGADYESFVSYWIAFKGAAFGFHDASWRSSFGGNIYKYAGSHGCVNMPYSKVRQLYNMIDIGTPVYIK